jgi:hypothetical protein
MSIFILDETTVFYHNLSLTKSNKPGSTIKDWRVHVAKEINSANQDFIGSIVSATSTTAVAKSRTTASSNAVWVKTEGLNAIAMRNKTSALGGFEDEDETEERNHALSSPLKAKQYSNAVSPTVQID